LPPLFGLAAGGLALAGLTSVAARAGRTVLAAVEALGSVVLLVTVALF